MRKQNANNYDAMNFVRTVLSDKYCSVLSMILPGMKSVCSVLSEELIKSSLIFKDGVTVEENDVFSKSQFDATFNM
jgi:hypothetical protein